jgi:hypothetical protein
MRVLASFASFFLISTGPEESGSSSSAMRDSCQQVQFDGSRPELTEVNQRDLIEIISRVLDVELATTAGHVADS